MELDWRVYNMRAQRALGGAGEPLRCVERDLREPPPRLRRHAMESAEQNTCVTCGEPLGGGRARDALGDALGDALATRWRRVGDAPVLARVCVCACLGVETFCSGGSS